MHIDTFGGNKVNARTVYANEATRRRKVGEFGGQTPVAVNSFQSWQRGGSKYLNSVAWNGEKGREEGEEEEEKGGGKKGKSERIKASQSL